MAPTALSQVASPTREPVGCESLRPNLHLATHYLGTRDKRAFLCDYVQEHAGQSGIIYCSTRKDVETLQALLAEEGVRATRDHGGLSDGERWANQDAFLHDDASVMVATNGFGVEGAKTNVRYTLHYNMPDSLETYYREALCAGRDGSLAQSILLWNDTDISTNRFLLERATAIQARPGVGSRDMGAARDKRLRAICAYCMTADCLNRCLIRYFRNDSQTSAHCDHCANCDAGEQPLDVTQLAYAVMRCVHEMRGSFGKAVIIDVLRGARGVKLEEMGLYDLKNYGTVDAPVVQLRVLIELMIARGYLVATEGTDPTIGYGPRWKRMTAPDFTLQMKKVERPGYSLRAP